MSPDPKKVQSTQQWPQPTNAREVRRFQGLASYYRRYIPHFLKIVAPLNALTQKGSQFMWTKECDSAFTTLKEYLVQAPTLQYPQFGPEASEFSLQTDASAVGLGAVFEQDEHVIAYASHALTPSEQQHSVIQRECLAVVYVLAPFAWVKISIGDRSCPTAMVVSSENARYALCQWALAIQEYDFDIVHRKGSLNDNADALSRVPISPCATTAALSHYSPADLCKAQEEDTVISKVIHAGSNPGIPPSSQEWNQYPLRRYRQLWHQLQIISGVLCQQYTPSPMTESVTVPILPKSLQGDALLQNHDAPTAGHQGFERTLGRLKLNAHWVIMTRDVEQYCRECTKCQQWN